MKKDYKKLFLHLEVPAPSADLQERILARIVLRERRILWLKLACFGAAFAGSISFVAYGAIALSVEVSHSGFVQFFSLFFSDFSATMHNFPDFALSIAESFPVFGAAFILGGIAFAVWSAARIIDEASLMRRHAHA